MDLFRAVQWPKGNTEKVARAVAIAENVKFRSTDNLVPRRLLDTHMKCRFPLHRHVHKSIAFL